MSDFLQKAIFFRLVLALILGIISCYLIGFQWFIFAIITILGVVLTAFFLFQQNIVKKYRFDWTFGIGILILTASLGYFSTHYYYVNNNLNFADKKGVFEVTLTDFPSEKQNSVLVYAKLNAEVDSTDIQSINGKIILFLQKDSNSLNLKSGDILLIYTTLSLPKNKHNPCEFDFGKYMQNKGLCSGGYADSVHWVLIGRDNGFSIVRLSQYCRIYLLDILKKMNLSGDEFGLAAALTLGYRDAVSPELRDSYVATGVTHILSVSGLHVGVVYMVFNFLFAFMDKGRRKSKVKPLIIISLLWFYAFIAGLCPSILRATLMFSLISVGGVIGRKPYTYNTIFASAFILLIINPLWFFDVGFQLSYSAVLAIIYFQPKIAKWLNFKFPPLQWAWNLTAVSIAAQLGTAPLAIYYFDQFPNYFLLANLIVIPFSSIVIYLSMALFAVFKVPYINVAVGFLLEWTIKIMNYCVKFIENLPNSLGVIYLTLYEMILLYGVVFAIGFLFYKCKFRPLATALTCLLLFFVSVTLKNIENKHFNQLTIFNDNKNFTLNIADNQTNMVFTNDSSSSTKLTKTFFVHYNMQMADYEVFDTINFGKPIFYHNQKILVLYADNFLKKYSEKPLEVDYLVVTKNIYPNENIFKYYFLPKFLIIAGNVSINNNLKFNKIAQKFEIPCYSIRDEGAFVLKN